MRARDPGHRAVCGLNGRRTGGLCERRAYGLTRGAAAIRKWIQASEMPPTPLHKAAERGNGAAVKDLLAVGADVNAKDKVRQAAWMVEEGVWADASRRGRAGGGREGSVYA